MKKKCVVLISGGMDSTTCLAIAVNRGFDCYGITFDYGQRHRAELNAAKRIARHFAIKEHKIISLDLGSIGGSALTDPTLSVPNHQNHKHIPITYVPTRNTTFLSIALGWAEVLNASDIFIGISAVDYSGYPDCRPEYIAAFQQLANLATKQGIEGNPIQINTPIIHLNKAQTIQLGLALGIDYKLTITCYRTNEKGEACGMCDSCILRLKGFNTLGIEDPITYRK